MSKKRYIECEVAVSQINDIDVTKPWNDKEDMLEQAIARLDHLPAADVVEVVHGEWLGTEVAYAWKCSACGGIMSLRANYCCYCGAKMDGGVSDGK